MHNRSWETVWTFVLALSLAIGCGGTPTSPEDSGPATDAVVAPDTGTEDPSGIPDDSQSDEPVQDEGKDGANGWDAQSGPSLVLVPDVVDFGFVGVGITAERNLTISNGGNGDLIVNEDGGCLQIMDDVKDEFSFVDTPFGWGPTDTTACSEGLVPAMDSRKIALTCTPKSLSGIATAKLRFGTNQEGMEQVEIPLICHRPPDASPLVIPGEIAFGKVLVGCESPFFEVCSHNTGPDPLAIVAIKFEDCSPEFKLKNVPALPADIPAGDSLCFDVIYTPQDEGTDSCSLRIMSTAPDSPKIDVPVTGEGVWESQEVDEFTQASGLDLDLLFVVDDSASMCGMPEALTGGFGTLVQQLDSNGVDYHVGVISMNVTDETVRGRLNEGNADQAPLYITPGTPDVTGTFAKLSDLGCDGGPNCGGLGGGCTDRQEAGLFAMWHALTPPLVGGWNAGFLREEAQLIVVALSSEDDQGPFEAPFYADFLTELKGVWNPNLVQFHAIVGLESPTCPQASPGVRYIAVAEATGGTVVDICTQGFLDVVNSMGTVSQALKAQFFLTRIPATGTLQVRVDGDPCLDGWSYDAVSNAIVFEPDGPCWPDPGVDIEVEYDVACAQI